MGRDPGAGAQCTPGTGTNPAWPGGRLLSGGGLFPRVLESVTHILRRGWESGDLTG